MTKRAASVKKSAKSVTSKKAPAKKKRLPTSIAKPVAKKSQTGPSQAAKKTQAKRAAKKIPAKSKQAAFDFAALPPGTVETSTRTLCLACVWKLFTKQLQLSPNAALTAIKKYEPSVAELTAAPPERPFFPPDKRNPQCPYCQAAERSHATLAIHRIVGSRASDAARKACFAQLPQAGQALVIEEKSARQSVVFHWLESLAARLNFADDDWMLHAAQALLEKREPKTDWPTVIAAAQRVQRSFRLESGWEAEGNRLFLAPDLWNEVLLFQYLLSRSQHGGGRTFEGRLTLGELLSRLRRRHYFADHAIESGDINDVLEALVESLDPGTATVRLYYVVDRRDLLHKLSRFTAR